MKRLLVTAVAAVTMLGTAPTAHAAYYGDSARSVAKEVTCKRFDRTGGGALNKDAGIYWLKGKRVNVITFAGKPQQRDWNEGARLLLPSDHWWANGKGTVITARNGNKAAARIGAKRLPGTLRHAI